MDGSLQLKGLLSETGGPFPKPLDLLTDKESTESTDSLIQLRMGLEDLRGYDTSTGPGSLQGRATRSDGHLGRFTPLSIATSASSSPESQGYKSTSSSARTTPEPQGYESTSSSSRTSPEPQGYESTSSSSRTSPEPQGYKSTSSSSRTSPEPQGDYREKALRAFEVVRAQKGAAFYHTPTDRVHHVKNLGEYLKARFGQDAKLKVSRIGEGIGGGSIIIVNGKGKLVIKESTMPSHLFQKKTFLVDLEKAYKASKDEISKHAFDEFLESGVVARCATQVVPYYQAAHRDLVAYAVARHLGISTPEVDVVVCDTGKVISAQRYEKKSLQLHSMSLSDREKINPIETMKMLILDLIILNYDRNEKNVMYKKQRGGSPRLQKDGTVHLFAIDHSISLPELKLSGAKAMFTIDGNCLVKLLSEHLSNPLPDEIRGLLASVDSNKLLTGIVEMTGGIMSPDIMDDLILRISRMRDMAKDGSISLETFIHASVKKEVYEAYKTYPELSLDELDTLNSKPKSEWALKYKEIMEARKPKELTPEQIEEQRILAEEDAKARAEEAIFYAKMQSQDGDLSGLMGDFS